MFITILGPIWCDSNAPEDKKTTWITWFIVATPVGIVFGYLETAIILSQDANWAYGFYVQVFLLVPIACFIATVDPKLLMLTEANENEDAIETNVPSSGPSVADGNTVSVEDDTGQEKNLCNLYFK